jgi:hypothetical protein
VLDDALLVDDDVGALRPFISFLLHVIALENPVRGQDLLIHVAQQWKGDINLFGKRGIRRRTVHTDSKNLRVRSINLSRCDSSLDRLKLLGSTSRESQNVDR